MEEFLSTIITYMSQFGLKLIGALLLLFIGFRLIKFFIKKLKNSKSVQKLDNDIRGFTLSAISITLKLLIIISCIAICGVPMSSVIAVLGTAGLAIGLSLQGSLGNLAGGVVILAFKPFHVGDYIDTGAYAGTVEDIGVFYTRLTTVDNREIVLPNSSVSNTSLVNVNEKPLRRVDITFSVDYSSDTEQVKKLLLDTMTANEKVLSDPQPFARMTKHGDSALEFTARAWCKSENYWNVLFDFNESVKKAFDENGISIPFPQLDVHMKNNQ